MATNGDSSIRIQVYEPAPTVGMIVATCIADSGDGSFPATAIPEFEGRILDIITNPDTPAPTDNYSVALNDASGFDRLGGAGASRDTATTERAAVTGGWASRLEAISLAITGNSVHSAKTVVTIHFSRIG